MSAATENRLLRAADTPVAADLRALDGSPDEMFPLRTADEVGKLIGFSGKYVHNLMDTGQLPYVLWPRGCGGRGDVQKEARNRRVRNDHLREAVQRLTQD